MPEEDENWEYLEHATRYIIANEKWKPFAQAVDKELSKEDRAFICRIMKLDPRERPTARELLEVPWLQGI